MGDFAEQGGRMTADVKSRERRKSSRHVAAARIDLGDVGLGMLRRKD